MTVVLWDMNYGKGVFASRFAGFFKLVECEADLLEILIAEILFCASSL